MKSRMYSSLGMLSRLGGDTTTTMKSDFLGTKEVVNPSDEWTEAILDKAKAYTDSAIEGSGHLTEIITPENSGLEITDKNNIDIDDDITFILDCNYDEDEENTTQE